MELENEYAISARYPRIPTIHEGMIYPAAVAERIAVMNELFGMWADEETTLMNAEEDLKEAKLADAKAFKDSVLADAKDPGRVHEPRAARELERQRIILANRLVEVNKAGTAVSESIQAHAKEIILEGIAMARAGVAEQERLVMEAGRLLVEASQARQKGIQGLVQASELTRHGYRFEPNFPISRHVVMPDVHEHRIKEVCEGIERMIEKGNLFPDASALRTATTNSGVDSRSHEDPQP